MYKYMGRDDSRRPFHAYNRTASYNMPVLDGMWFVAWLRQIGLEFTFEDQLEVGNVDPRNFAATPESNLSQYNVATTAIAAQPLLSGANTPLGMTDIVVPGTADEGSSETSPNHHLWVLRISCPALNAMGVKTLFFDVIQGPGTSELLTNTGWKYVVTVEGGEAARTPTTLGANQETNYDRWWDVSRFSTYGYLPPTEAAGIPSTILSSEPSVLGAYGLAEYGVFAATAYAYTMPPGTSGVTVMGHYSISGQLDTNNLYIVAEDDSVLTISLHGSEIVTLYEDSAEGGDNDVGLNEDEKAQLANVTITSVLGNKNIGLPFARLGDLVVEKQAQENEMSIADETYREEDAAREIPALTFAEAMAITNSAKDTRWLHFFVDDGYNTETVYDVKLTGPSSDPQVDFYEDTETKFTNTYSLLTESQLADIRTAEISGAGALDETDEGDLGTRDEIYSFILNAPIDSIGAGVVKESQLHFDEMYQMRAYRAGAEFNASVRAATAMAQVIGSRSTFTDLASGNMAYWNLVSKRLNGMVTGGPSAHSAGKLEFDNVDTGFTAGGDQPISGIEDNPYSPVGETPLDYDGYLADRLNQEQLFEPVDSTVHYLNYKDNAFETEGPLSAARRGTTGYGTIWQVNPYAVDGPRAKGYDAATFIDLVRKGFRSYGEGHNQPVYKSALTDWLLTLDPLDFIGKDIHLQHCVPGTAQTLGINDHVIAQHDGSVAESMRGGNSAPQVLFSFSGSGVNITISRSRDENGELNYTDYYPQLLANQLGYMLVKTSGTDPVDVTTFSTVKEALDAIIAHADTNALMVTYSVQGTALVDAQTAIDTEIDDFYLAVTGTDPHDPNAFLYTYPPVENP